MRESSDTVKRARAKLEAEGVEVEWTTAEVAAYLGYSVRRVQDFCDKRRIPHRRFTPPGHERPQLRFRRDEIDAWRERFSEVVAV